MTVSRLIRSIGILAVAGAMLVPLAATANAEQWRGHPGGGDHRGGGWHGGGGGWHRGGGYYGGGGGFDLGIVVAPPPVYYAPPPVYYAPPPVVYYGY